jgi:hypothetical protein
MNNPSSLVLHHKVPIGRVLILESLRNAVGIVALAHLANQMITRSDYHYT